MYHNLSSHKNQACNENLLSFIESLPRGAQNFLTLLVWFGRKFGRFAPSQEKLADMVGMSREYANRLIQQLKKEGLVMSIYRHRKTCIYTIHDFFYTPLAHIKLSHIFRSHGPLYLMSLFMAAQMFGMENRKDSPLSKRLKSGSGSQQITPIIREDKNINNHTYNCKKVRKKFPSGTYEYSPVEKKVQSEMVSRESSDRAQATAFGQGKRSIKGIEVTKWGHIRLAGYPDEALEYVNKLLRDTIIKENVDPFKWIEQRCIEYCYIHRVEPQWHIVKYLSSYYGMPPSAPLVTRKKPKVPIQSVGYTGRSYSSPPRMNPYGERSASHQRLMDRVREESRRRNEEYSQKAQANLIDIDNKRKIGEAWLASHGIERPAWLDEEFNRLQDEMVSDEERYSSGDESSDNEHGENVSPTGTSTSDRPRTPDTFVDETDSIMAIYRTEREPK